MKKSIFFQLLLLLTTNTIIAQAGKDGTLTINSLNYIVNKYCPVSTNISSGSNTVAVTTSSFIPLCPGDLIMVYQAQGAAINPTNSPLYGDITAYNSAGLYEFKYVQSVSGNTITTQTTFANSYAIAGRVQVIKVPQYSTLTINAGASVIAKAWKDTSISATPYRFGGLVVIHAANIVNNGTITASGAGFRGGALFLDSGINTGATAMSTTLTSQGAEKGESLAGYQTDYDIIGGRYGMGSPANGGGGGNNHNGGGGGGGNGFNGNNWTGQGVMIVNGTNPLAAWSLSSGYITNSNALTNSSGGGHGGYSWGNSAQNPSTVGPGNGLWSGDSRREVGGIGGRPLANINAETRIYFGGGGGAPHENNNVTNPGSNGGGIVYLIASSGITGNGNISSNGNIAGNATGCSCDAAPGGGAGGSIIVKTGAIVLSQNISAIGGNGGSQMALNPPGSNTDESEGPGGGGGGGFVAISTGAIIPAISGGLNGVSFSGAITGMPANGATQGATGQTGTVSTNFISYTVAQISYTTLCEGATLSLNSPSVGTLYQWSGPNGFNSNLNNIVIPNIGVSNAGSYFCYITNVSGCGSTAQFSVSTINSGPTLSTQNLTICVGSKATLTVSGAQTYSWSNSQTTSSIQVTPSTTTIYTVQGFGADGCRSTSTIQVKVIPCTGIEEIKNAVNIQVYPNPNDGNFIIKSEKDVQLNLINALGELICVINLNEACSRKINLSNLSKGIYFLKSVNRNTTLTKKIIVLD